MLGLLALLAVGLLPFIMSDSDESIDENEEELDDEVEEGRADEADIIDLPGRSGNQFFGDESDDLLIQHEVEKLLGEGVSSIFGGGGDDRIYGEGDVCIFGGVGNDALIIRDVGSNGETHAFGGSGSDLFVIEVIEVNETDGAIDIVDDFDSQEDSIEIFLVPSSDYDPINDIKFSTNFEVESLISTVGAEGTFIELKAVQHSVTEAGDDIKVASDTFSRVFLIKGIYDIDAEDILIEIGSAGMN